jgi:hypothetical protein
VAKYAVWWWWDLVQIMGARLYKEKAPDYGGWSQKIVNCGDIAFQLTVHDRLTLQHIEPFTPLAFCGSGISKKLCPE